MSKKTLNLKQESLNTAGSTTPPPLLKHKTDHGSNGKMPQTGPRPVDAGGMSTGSTGGNHVQTKIPNMQVKPGEGK